MTDNNVIKLAQPGTFIDSLTEILRNGARALLAQAVEAEPPACLDGTFTQASPSSTSSPATEQVQASRARNFSGISSATETFTSTVSPIFTGARKFSVCEI